MATIGIVIVNFNAGEHLARCLGSLDEGLGGHQWAAAVVDNASADGSAEFALGRPGVELVRSNANVGFARAVNLGTSHVTGELLLLVNPDCRLTLGCVDPLVEELATHPSCGIAAPAVVNEAGLPDGNARGDPSMLTGLFGRSSLLRRLMPRAGLARRNVVLPSGLPPGSVSDEVDWVAGSCALMRRKAFDAVGGFDERYFLYWEDADLCRRLRTAGWRVRFRTDAVVVHAGGCSARGSPGLATREFHRSAYLYYTTHVARSPWDPRRGAAAILLGVRQLVVGSRSPARETRPDQRGR